jgi:hypothetical protein
MPPGYIRDPETTPVSSSDEESSESSSTSSEEDSVRAALPAFLKPTGDKGTTPKILDKQTGEIHKGDGTGCPLCFQHMPSSSRTQCRRVFFEEVDDDIDLTCKDCVTAKPLGRLNANLM